MNGLLRLLGWLLALALVALPVVAVLNGWVGSDRWPLTRLRVTGEFTRVDPQRLRETVLPYARDGFFAVRLEDAQAAVAELPWVEHAEVRKRWPDVLEVRVTEHHPFARWGDELLLSEHGELFSAELASAELEPGRPGSDEAAAVEPIVAGPPATGADRDAGKAAAMDLPLLHGPESRVADVVALYNQARALFAPLGLQVRTLELDARGSWSLQLHDRRTGNDTQVLVGRNEARARLARFTRLIPQLLHQGEQQLVRADLRYTNGFALTWDKTEIGNRKSEIEQPTKLGSIPLPGFRFAAITDLPTPHSPLPISGSSK